MAIMSWCINMVQVALNIQTLEKFLLVSITITYSQPLYTIVMTTTTDYAAF